MNARDIRVIVLGTSSFGVPLLRALNDAGYQIQAVVTQPGKTASPLESAAAELGLTVYKPEKIIELRETLKAYQPDIALVAAYGQYIPKEIFTLPAHKTLNVHASLLPHYRGAAPIQPVIINGEKETGVTLFEIVERMDAGPIIAQRVLPLTGTERYAELHDALAKLSARMVLEALPDYVAGKIIPVPQDESAASLAPKIKKEDGFVDFREPAEVIERKTRAYEGWPGIYTAWNGTVLKLLSVRTAVSAETAEPGRVRFADGSLVVDCAKDRLVVLSIQPEGKAPMSGRDFKNGYPQSIGARLPS